MMSMRSEEQQNEIMECLAWQVIRRFWSKVKLGDKCWEWQAGVNHGGYGQFTITLSTMRDTTVLAHRVAWMLVRGSVPVGKCLCHKCDNPRCVNPDHMFIGTRADNNRDMFRKGRGSCIRAKGEAHGMSVMTADAVYAIRALTDNGNDQRAVARKFGISQSQVGRIHRRESWAHLPEALIVA